MPCAHMIRFNFAILHLKRPQWIFKRPQWMFSEVIPLLERALSIQQDKLGENHPDTTDTQSILDLVRATQNLLELRLGQVRAQR